MRLNDDQSISTCPRQPYARFRMSGATIQTRPGPKSDVQRVSLSFAGPYNRRVRLTLLPARGTAIELELPRREVWKLADWLLEETTQAVPGSNWPDSKLKRLVASNPSCLPQAYCYASAPLKTEWQKAHPELSTH